MWYRSQKDKLIPKLHTQTKKSKLSILLLQVSFSIWQEEIGISLKKMREWGREETESLLKGVEKIRLNYAFPFINKRTFVMGLGTLYPQQNKQS